MAPVVTKPSPLVMTRLVIAGVVVDALVDTGATTSCCRWGWYKEWKSRLGNLIPSSSLVVGVGNVPIEVKGLTSPVKLSWDGVEGNFSFLVLSTLVDVDVILGMDILGELKVSIDASNKLAWPQAPCLEKSEVKTEVCRPKIQQESCALVLDCNWKIPAGKSKIFLLDNDIPGPILFEPGENLPE